jgi:hypothetical protein
LIERVTRVHRITIHTYLGAVSSMLFDLLGAAMALMAQGLQRAVEERIRVAIVWLDVVSDLSRHDLTLFEAIDTERMKSYLRPRLTLPSLGVLREREHWMP